MEKVFLSYRREDSQWPADRIYETLNRSCTNPDFEVFIDVDGIPLGMDFHDHLDTKVAQCDVLLALIGHGWLNARDSETGARRLDDKNDFVRIEIASALRRDIPVVPVLLDGARVPNREELPEDLKPLSRRNGIEVKRTSFNADIEKLIKGLGLDEKDNKSLVRLGEGEPQNSQVTDKDDSLSTIKPKNALLKEKAGKTTIGTKHLVASSYDERGNKTYWKIAIVIGLLLIYSATYFSYEEYQARENERSSLQLKLAQEKELREKIELEKRLNEERVTEEKAKLDARLAKEKAVLDQTLLEAKLAKERTEKKLLNESNKRKRLEKEAEELLIKNEADQRRLAEQAERQRLEEEAEQSRLEEIDRKNLLAQEAKRKKLALEAERENLAKIAKAKFPFGSWSGDSKTGDSFVEAELGEDHSTLKRTTSSASCDLTLTFKSPLRDLKSSRKIRGTGRKTRGSWIQCAPKLSIKLEWLNSNHLLIKGYSLGIIAFTADLTRSE